VGWFSTVVLAGAGADILREEERKRKEDDDDDDGEWSEKE